MKKIIVVLISCLFLIGCGCVVEKASDSVRSYLNKYNLEDESIKNELDKVTKNFSEDDKKVYEEIMEKQYKDLNYKILEEKYNGDNAIVTTKIQVYDLYNIQENVNKYKEEHKNEFTKEDGSFDNEKFLKYKLEEMKKETKKIEYTIDFKVHKKDGKWILESISERDLEKIHGIYND